MRIDLHCPIELTGYELLRDDRRNARAYLKLFNLSHERACRIEAVVHFMDGEGNQADQTLSSDAINAGPRQSFSLSLPADALPGATKLWISFTRIGFESDRPAWIGHPSRLLEIPEPKTPGGRELNQLMRVAGRDAICFPALGEAYWLCVCARPNARRRKLCARCGRERDSVLAQYDRERVLASQPILTPSGDQVESPPSRRPLKSPDAAQLLRRKFTRQRQMLIRRTITMLVVAALIALGAWAVRVLRERNLPPESIPPIKIEDNSAI